MSAMAVTNCRRGNITGNALSVPECHELNPSPAQVGHRVWIPAARYREEMAQQRKRQLRAEEKATNDSERRKKKHKSKSKKDKAKKDKEEKEKSEKHTRERSP
jgi:hypothetical protein